MRHRLIQLLADNRANAGRRFEVLAAGDDEAEVFLYDAIVADELEAEWFGGVAAAPFVKALRAIDAKTIRLRVNSPGGSVFAARAMEQALREHPARIVAHIDGLAASAASFVVMGADEIVVAKGAMLMIHNGWTFALGNAADMRSTAALLDKIDATLVQTYAERTKQSAGQIAGWMAAETWFSADEALAHGFADRVAEAVKAEACAAWNLSAYLAAPKAASATEPAPEPDCASADHRFRQQQRMRVLAAAPLA